MTSMRMLCMLPLVRSSHVRLQHIGPSQQSTRRNPPSHSQGGTRGRGTRRPRPSLPAAHITFCCAAYPGTKPLGGDKEEAVLVDQGCATLSLRWRILYSSNVSLKRLLTYCMCVLPLVRRSLVRPSSVCGTECLQLAKAGMWRQFHWNQHNEHTGRDGLVSHHLFVSHGTSPSG